VSAARAESNLAKKVVRLERLVKGLKPEIKFTDISLASNNISSANGAVIHMTQIAQGAAINQRISENVLVKHVEMHMEISTGTGVALSTNDNPSYRVYIVQDKQQVADTSPAVIDFVDQPSLPVTQLTQVTEQKRFRILYDSGPQMVYTGSLGAAAVNLPSSEAVMMCKFHLHFKRSYLSIPVEFNGTATTDIQKNGIYFMISTDMTGAAGVNVLDIIGSSRIGYTDV